MIDLRYDILLYLLIIISPSVTMKEIRPPINENNIPKSL